MRAVVTDGDAGSTGEELAMAQIKPAQRLAAMQQSFDRRAVLAFITGGTVALKCQPALARADEIEGVPFADDEASRMAAADDYGHFVRRIPRHVVRPRDGDDVAKILDHARRGGTKVVVRGRGHSSYGQAQIDGGIVLDMSSLARVGEIDGETISVESGARWEDIVAVTLPRGLVPPVLPDALMLSVGGTLSVGGLGDTSFRHGAQVDHVRELDVLTVSGRRVVCSETKESELFFAVLAGLGQVGVILRAKVALRLAPASVAIRSWTFGDVGAYLAAQRQLSTEASVDHLTGRVLRQGTNAWSFRLDAGRFLSAGETSYGDWPTFEAAKPAQPQETSFVSYLNRLDPVVAAARSSGDWTAPHPSFQFFMSFEQTGQFLNARIDNEHLMRGVRRFDIMTVDRSAFRLPNLQMPGERHACVVRLLRTAPKDKPDVLAAMLKVNQMLLADVIKAGAKIYPPYAPIPQPDYWPQHFGREAWDRVLRLRREFDPTGALNGSALTG